MKSRYLTFFLITVCASIIDSSVAETSAVPAEKKVESKAFDIEKLLLPWKADLERTSKPAVWIDLKPVEDNRWISKVGGLPYLPETSKWPVNVTSNAPLQFLAQINFAEVPETPGYPREGMLQFFVSDDDLMGLNLDSKNAEIENTSQKTFRVVFFPKVDKGNEKLAEVKLPPAPETFPIDPKITLQMHFRSGKERVSVEDDIQFKLVFGMDYYDFVEVLAKTHSLNEDDLGDALSEKLNPETFGHKIGGFPGFTQQDPRSADSKLQLLFQLGTEGGQGWDVMWGDSGIGAFFITPDDLAQRNFSRVLYNWDCY